MPNVKQRCLHRLTHLVLHKRFIPCAIFLTAVVPFLFLNYYAYLGNNNEDDTYPIYKFNGYLQTGTRKVKRRFLEQMMKRNRSIPYEDNSIFFIEDVDDTQKYKKDFYVHEQILAEELAAANKQYEEECSRKLISNSSNATTVTQKSIPNWQLKLTKCKDVQKTKFFLTSALQVRIYQADKAKWTMRELKQWLHYMFWSGIEHVYLCDHYHFASEILFIKLKRYIDAQLVTYIDWSKIVTPMTAQVACYQNIIDRYGADSVWQLAVDMDEYPFMPNDTNENFLIRYLQSMSFSVTEVSLHNFLMLGHGNRSRTMAIERITRMTPEPANDLDKPIYRPSRVVASIHHNMVKHGKRFEANDREIRLLHYWGSRINHFGPDPPDLKFKTIEYTELRDSLSLVVRNSLVSFGELDSFSNNTGP